MTKATKPKNHWNVEEGYITKRLGKYIAHYQDRFGDHLSQSHRTLGAAKRCIAAGTSMSIEEELDTEGFDYDGEGKGWY
jgi:hypothetical protein